MILTMAMAYNIVNNIIHLSTDYFDGFDSFCFMAFYNDVSCFSSAKPTDWAFLFFIFVELNSCYDCHLLLFS